MLVGVESSSPVTQLDSQTELTSKDPTDESMGNQNQNTPVIAQPEDVDATAPVENHHEENQLPPHGVQTTQSGDFLGVTYLPMGRSSR
jgi:hypothetical protein